MRRRFGWCQKRNQVIACVVTGEMVDGRKVWTECNEKKEPVNIDRQYILKTYGNNFSEFIQM